VRPTAPLKEPRGGSVQYWGVGVEGERWFRGAPPRKILSLLILSLSGSVEFSYNSIIDNGRIVLLWRVS
jgi:hypothetical protein